jgi:hypothetical protein
MLSYITYMDPMGLQHLATTVLLFLSWHASAFGSLRCLHLHGFHSGWTAAVQCCYCGSTQNESNEVLVKRPLFCWLVAVDVPIFAVSELKQTCPMDSIQHHFRTFSVAPQLVFSLPLFVNSGSIRDGASTDVDTGVSAIVDAEWMSLAIQY